MKTMRLRISRSGCLALMAAFGAAPWSSGQTPPSKSDTSSARLFAEPVLVKGSLTNLGAFDVSWNDNSTHKYYLADRTNNAIDLVDSATDTFLGFIGQGHFTGSRPCPGQPKELRHCAGPNGVVTDDLGHVWPGDGDGNLVEADATKPGTAIIRSIPTGGKGRVDELAYDPISRILYAENDGDTPPRITFVSGTDGAVLGHYVYPMDQDGMEQPVWVRQTELFLPERPGRKNRIDVFDPPKLPNPVKSFPVECSGGLLETKSGTTQVSNSYYFSRSAESGGVAVVNAVTEKFVGNIPLGSHSVAVNAKNKYVFVPLAGKGIFVIAPKE